MAKRAQTVMAFGDKPLIRRSPENRDPRVATELQVHIAVAGHLKHRSYPGVVWWHTPNGEIREKSAASKLKAMGLRAGIPDILAYYGGRLYGLELKRDKGRLSPEQRETIAALELQGAYCATAYGIDEAVKILGEWGLIKSDMLAKRPLEYAA